VLQDLQPFSQLAPSCILNLNINVSRICYHAMSGSQEYGSSTPSFSAVFLLLDCICVVCRRDGTDEAVREVFSCIFVPQMDLSSSAATLAQHTESGSFAFNFQLGTQSEEVLLSTSESRRNGPHKYVFITNNNDIPQREHWAAKHTLNLLPTQKSSRET